MGHPLSPGQTKEVTLERAGSATDRAAPDRGRQNGTASASCVRPATGVIVTDPQPGRPAAKAGLSTGDRIVSIDGVEMTTISKVIKTIQAAPATAALRHRAQRAAPEMDITPVREGERA